jgi:hypothetical protein
MNIALVLRRSISTTLMAVVSLLGSRPCKFGRVPILKKTSRNIQKERIQNRHLESTFPAALRPRSQLKVIPSTRITLKLEDALFGSRALALPRTTGNPPVSTLTSSIDRLSRFWE